MVRTRCDACGHITVTTSLALPNLVRISIIGKSQFSNHPELVLKAPSSRPLICFKFDLRVMSRNMAQPVYREPFSYSDDLLQVQVENGNKRDSHSREDSGRLYAFLTYTPPTGPALTKNGTVRVHQPDRHVDLTASCYTAQLVHYGLKPFKSKPAAKKALLAAYAAQGGTLKVPDDVLRIEQELKTEWTRQNELANKTYHAEKRKREDDERQELTRRPWAKGNTSGSNSSHQGGDRAVEQRVAVQTARKSKKVRSFVPRPSIMTTKSLTLL